jgi:hypothetical protein
MLMQSIRAFLFTGALLALQAGAAQSESQSDGDFSIRKPSRLLPRCTGGMPCGTST